LTAPATIELPRSTFGARFRWVVLLAAVFICIAGAIRAGIFHQAIWSPAGQRRFFLYSALFAAGAALIFRVRRAALLPCFAAAVCLYTAALIGPQAVLALLFFSLGCYGIGLEAFRALRFQSREADQELSQDALAILTGAAIWGFAASLLAFTKWNWPIVHGLLLAVPAITGARHIWRRARIGVYPTRISTQAAADYWAMALLLYVLGAQFLMALKPEVSADGLAIHLVVPMHMAIHHFWHFDVSQISWAVMPMAAEWCFTTCYLLGGEFAAKLLPFVFLCVSCAVIVRLCRRLTSRSAALLIAAVYAATPAVQLITGALFTDMVWAAFLLGASVLILQWTESREAAALLPAGILLGAAMATKFLALSFLAPCLAWVLFNCFDRKRGIDRKSLSALLVAIVLCVIVAAPPYATAWMKTGNPVFPYFNDIFRSPHYDMRSDWADARWQVRFTWHSLFDMTFRSSKFLEGQNGALGLSWIFLLLLFLTAPRSMFTRPVLAALGIGAVFFVLTWSRASYIRYLVPAFPLLLFGFAAYLRALHDEQPNLYRIIAAATAASVLSGAYLLPSSGFWHKDFCLNPLRFQAESAKYISENAPAREMIDYLNRTAPGEPVAFFWTGMAGLQGRPYTSGSHTFEFFKKIEAAPQPEDVKELMAKTGIRYFVTPLAACGEPNFEQVTAFILFYTEPRFYNACLAVAETKSARGDPLWRVTRKKLSPISEADRKTEAK
jgi:hypothetical protein